MILGLRQPKRAAQPKRLESPVRLGLEVLPELKASCRCDVQA